MSQLTISPQIEESWKNVLMPVFQTPWFAEIKSGLLKEKAAGKKIYPPGSEIFSAFNLTPFNQVKAVILGQDPYHGPGQAHGLCFSVRDGVPFPPSLRNIFKELSEDIGAPKPESGNLQKWAKQGVLLLNAVITVEANKPGSHRKLGWERFTDSVIEILSSQQNGLVFILWGNFARQKAGLIDRKKHFVLEAAHPSPFSADNGFFGCRHFSKTNKWLVEKGKTPIDWDLTTPGRP